MENIFLGKKKNREIIESFNCGVCKEICNNPVESSCCANLYCLECSNKLQDQCSICRTYCTFRNSDFAKNLINKSLSSCEYCKLTTLNLESHYQDCNEFLIECPIENCLIGKISRCQILKHVFDVHKDEVKVKLPSILNLFKKTTKVTF